MPRRNNKGTKALGENNCRWRGGRKLRNGYIGIKLYKNGIRSDNRIENLELLSDLGHNQTTLLEKRLHRLENEVKEQAKVIRFLKWQIKESHKVTI